MKGKNGICVICNKKIEIKSNNAISGIIICDNCKEEIKNNSSITITVA
ncbi:MULTISPECIES: hypothetical protein [Clostridium]|uniref:Uncharacterized protein n=1 Tax=Clostridium botulinum TaxID=1491 RepID=A0A077K022_CLOBO|nr:MULTISPECIES: hypothetical protein [Clostridium]MDS1006636.1 hypothetical protein [Clostridium sporogenes]BAP25541.1 hypothetical protein [Clostridium botulinum]